MKWEYRMEIAYLINRGKRRLEGDALEALGKNGWELINICEDIAYFKRPLEEVSIDLEGIEEKIAEVIAEMFGEAFNGEEEKEAALKEEENKEDQGESERTAWHPFNCLYWHPSFPCCRRSGTYC